jgi:hypothetical protein
MNWFHFKKMSWSCQNLKGALLTKGLKRIAIWISLKWQLAQVSQQQNWSIKSFWFSSIIKWMLKTWSVHCSGGKTWKHENMFPTIGFYVKQILRVVRSQIEIEKIFSLVEIFSNFKRCRLQSKNLDKLIFVNKIWFKWS